MPNVEIPSAHFMTRRAGAAVKMRYSASSGPLIGNTTPGRPSGRSDALLASTAHSSLSAVAIASKPLFIRNPVRADRVRGYLQGRARYFGKKSCRRRERFSDRFATPRGNEFAVRLHLRCPRHLSYRRPDAGEGRSRDGPAGEAGRSHRDPLQQSEVTEQISPAGALHRLRKMFTPKRAVEESAFTSLLIRSGGGSSLSPTAKSRCSRGMSSAVMRSAR